MLYSFEKLVVWQESRELVRIIYAYTAEFPTSEQFGLANQMRRASISVCSNIAEATGRNNHREKLQFYRISYASLMELLSQLIVSSDLGFMDPVVLENELRPLINRISFKLYSLKNKTQRD